MSFEIPKNVTDDIIKRGFYYDELMERAWSPIGAGGKLIYFISIDIYSMEYDTSDDLIGTHKYGEGGYMYPIQQDEWNTKTKEVCDRISNIKKLSDKI